MARKKVDLQAQRERKKKMIAIGGVVVLVGLLVIQVPKTLKLMNRSSPAESPAAAAARDEENRSDTPAPVSFQTSAPQSSAAPSADEVPGVEYRQLASFERFSAKDPFAQQIRERSESSQKAGKSRPAKKKAKRGQAKSPKTSRAGAKLRPTGAKQAPLPTSAVISTNGSRETVQVGERFPAGQKPFVLVAVTRDGVRIGIAEGSLVGGKETLTLERGKSITLENTASGTRYELRLISVS